MAGMIMKFGSRFPGKRKLLYLMGILAALIVFYQFSEFSIGSYYSESSPGKEASVFVTFRSSPHPRIPTIVNKTDLVERVDNMAIDDDVSFSKNMSRMMRFRSLWNGTDYSTSVEESHNVNASSDFSAISSPNTRDRMESLGTMLNSLLEMNTTVPSTNIEQVVELEAGFKNRDLEYSWKNESCILERYVRKMRGTTVTLSEMKSMLLNGPASSISMKRKWSSPRDRELVSASLRIKNAPVLRSFPDLHAPLFRNASVFKMSYELMTRILKIYVYKEGETPIFHEPRVRGIYAAEGWFMKLVEKSKQFVVRDPKKAHLFYLPFSSNSLRSTLHDHSMKDLERYLSGYVDIIKKKHRFWNRTNGADHFLVACHDWGPRITRTHMSNCIRALCNTNVARGFSIGKDVAVPVTYVRSGNEPTRDIGGKPPSERDILAFFAGQMHGYVRPLLLKYWENRAPDMKIFGPMKRDVEGKAVYREYMKSSKFCICAKGYGVHTPRVVESIFYECVPVIISDNYVPPFFEVLDWEEFAVFVLEKDIPNLRNILVSIPEDRYFEMHLRVKMVQKHFIWHKVPEKYDLFHMILHSIWYSRVSRMRPS
ncbi:putative glycosyltransferase At3g07620 [Silene latifolia]|uniref:putative glycosyltransferase At3g07620 n=1 Tax=Silene latifolia TaxID=37657 RepID=UPI003D78179E